MADNYDDIIETLSDDDVEEIPPAPIPQSTEDSGFASDDAGDIEEVDGEVVRDKKINIDHEKVEQAKSVISEYSVANPIALISMICGLISVVCCFIGTWNLIFALTAIVTGIVSIVISSENKPIGLAVTGIVSGFLGLVLCIIVMIFNGIGQLLQMIFR